MRAVVYLLINAVPLCAQQGVSSATLGGEATDPSGARVPGISVVALDTERNRELKTTADNQGRYQFLYLRPGAYQLRVEDARFAIFSFAVTVAAGQALN